MMQPTPETAKEGGKLKFLATCAQPFVQKVTSLISRLPRNAEDMTLVTAAP